MPLYDYQCSRCGPFKEFQPLSKWNQDAACPICRGAAKRTIATPRLPCVSRNTRIAHERNERSAEEPRVMRRSELYTAHGPIPRHKHQHGRSMYRNSVLGHAH